MSESDQATIGTPNNSLTRQDIEEMVPSATESQVDAIMDRIKSVADSIQAESEAACYLLLNQVVPRGDLGCRFDHNGDCQEHGYFGIGPGGICPQAQAEEWLKNYEDSVILKRNLEH